jgi:DNA-binding MarR family transcriptional regulator
MNTNSTNKQTEISEAEHISNTYEQDVIDLTNFYPIFQEQRLGVKIKKEVLDQIIEHGLNKVQSRLFFYLLSLDRDGNEVKNTPSLQEMAEAIGMSINQVKKSLTKLEELGVYKIETYPKGYWRGKRTSRS